MMALMASRRDTICRERAQGWLFSGLRGYFPGIPQNGFFCNEFYKCLIRQELRPQFSRAHVGFEGKAGDEQVGEDFALGVLTSP